MSSTGKITRIMPNGGFSTQNGQFYSFHVEIDSLKVYEANAKSEQPRWKVGDQVWFTVTGEHQGISKIKISLQDPANAVGGASGGYSGGGGARTQDPATQKRIENSWAVQVAVQIAGPMKGDQDQYLERIQNLAGHLLTIRDKVVPIETQPF